MEDYPVFRVPAVGSSVPPIMTDVKVCGKLLRMQIDTGASVSLISAKDLDELGLDVPIRSTSTQLHTYSGEPIPVNGELVVTVEHGGKSFPEMRLLVVSITGPSLFGRDWLAVMKPTIYGHEGEVLSMPGSGGNDQEAMRHRVESSFPDLFGPGMGCFRDVKAHITLQPEASPKFVKARPVPFAMRDRVALELDRLEKEDVIEKVKHAEWASPVVVIVKSDGETLRICGDYKATVNKVARIDHHPIPQVEELLARVSNCKYFTKLDLKHAYQQMELDEDTQEVLTINTIKGLYKFKRLPFGVSSAPAIFQRFMEQLLADISGVVVFFDDILIGAPDLETLEQRTREVCRRIQEAGGKLKSEKCEFGRTEVTFLGRVVNERGQSTMPEKVRAVENAPEPQNASQLKSFIGLVSYYQQFVPNLATVLVPLYELLRKGALWKWTVTRQRAFEKAKSLLASAGTLSHYDPSSPLVLTCDASAHGIGAVLAHVQPDGVERPVAFASRTLNSAERNYSQVEKEALACVFGVTKFHMYLYGLTFKLVTDHRPLLRLLGGHAEVPGHVSGRLTRWSLALAAYSYTIMYKEGKKLCNADALSRLPLSDVPSKVPESGDTVLLFKTLDSGPVSSADIARLTDHDPVLSTVRSYIIDGWPSEVPRDYNSYLNRKLELSVASGCVKWRTRVIVPTAARQRILQELHEGHPGVERMKAVARSWVWWPGLDKDCEQLVCQCYSCQLHRQAPPKSPLQSLPWPDLPWQRVHIDYAGPFQGCMFLIVVDAYTKWIEVIKTSGCSSRTTVEALRPVFATFGLPEVVVSDNGPAFVSDEFANFLGRNGVAHHRVSPYHPESNGQAERAVRVVKEGLKKMSDSFTTEKLYCFLLAYRSTPHTTTGESPAILMFGRELRNRLSQVKPTVHETKHPAVADKVVSQQIRQKQYHDRNTKERRLVADEPVLVQLKPLTPWLPGTVVRMLGPLSVDIKLEDGRRVQRHLDDVRARTCASSPEAGQSRDQERPVLVPPMPEDSCQDLEKHENKGSLKDDERKVSSPPTEENVSEPEEGQTPSVRRSNRISKQPNRWGY